MKELYRRYRETYGIPTPREWLCFAELVGLLVFAELLARMVGGVY